LPTRVTTKRGGGEKSEKESVRQHQDPLRESHKLSARERFQIADWAIKKGLQKRGKGEQVLTFSVSQKARTQEKKGHRHMKKGA